LSVLPPAVEELLRCCFEDSRENPALRPSAARWQQALAEAENDLTTCAQNAQHRYARGLDVCPWCLLARQQGRDPFPPVEEVQARSSETPRQPSTGENPSGPDVSREDPAPPVPPTAAVSKPGWAAAGLGKVGSLVERHGWVAWLGAILVGTVAGMLWALERGAAPAAKDQTRTVAADRREANPAASPPLPQTLTPKKGPEVAAGGGRPEAPVATRPGSPLAGAGAPSRRNLSTRKADQELQEATYAYLSALQAYQEAVAGSLRGEVSQQEVNRLYRKVQAAERKQQAGWQEVIDALSDRPAPRPKGQKPSPP
jgi:hypothetical protein